MSQHPTKLIASAKAVLELQPESIVYRRGSAYLARQAIESAVRLALGPNDRSRMQWRSRFLVLGVLQPEFSVGTGHQLWKLWSRTIHYHYYELLPRHEVLANRIEQSSSWIAGLEEHTSQQAER
ncbi:MAG: hypothetical protein ACRBK7_02160 [Acidimicrobiales bacterium]